MFARIAAKPHAGMSVLLIVWLGQLVSLLGSGLSGFALGESVILPSVESSDLLQQYEEARLALLTASQTSGPASRYSVP